MMVLQRLFPCLLSSPLRELTLGSAVLWGLGDVGAQAVTHYSAQAQDKDKESISFGKKDKGFKINWHRVFNTSVAYGLNLGSCMGPAAYYRFSKRLQRGSYSTTAEAVGSSAVAEGILGTVDLAMFFPIMGLGRAGSVEQLFSKKSVEHAKQDLKRGFTPALVLGGAALPAALLTNWRFVPAPYQLHCMSLFGLLGSFSMSWLEQQQRDADSWKLAARGSVKKSK